MTSKNFGYNSCCSCLVISPLTIFISISRMLNRLKRARIGTSMPRMIMAGILNRNIRLFKNIRNRNFRIMNFCIKRDMLILKLFICSKKESYFLFKFLVFESLGEHIKNLYNEKAFSF